MIWPEATVNAADGIELVTPLVHCSANLTVEGAIVGKGGMAISGGSGATVSGNVTVTGGDVKADGIGLKSHHHVEHDGPSTGTGVG